MRINVWASGLPAVRHNEERLIYSVVFGVAGVSENKLAERFDFTIIVLFCFF